MILKPHNLLSGPACFTSHFFETLFRVAVCCVFFCFSSVLYAQQIVLNEDFENQTLNLWTGDTSHFTFFDDAGNTQLHLNAPDAGTTLFQTENKTAYGSWDFFIHQDFSPSNSNRGYIFLMSDRENLSGNVNGYALRTGESSSPNYFRLYRFEDGAEAEEILTGSLDISGGGPFQVRVTREDDGTWYLYESAGYGSEPAFSASAADNTFTGSDYFGLKLDYTSTRTDKFFFDDIIIENSEIFSAVQSEITSANTLDIQFNYQIDDSSFAVSDFSVNNGIANPAQADLISGYTIRLTWREPFPDGDHALTINNVENIFGSKITPDTQLTFSVENPFYVLSAGSPENRKVEVHLTEEVDEQFVDPRHFSLAGRGSPDHVVQIQSGLIEMTYNTPLEAGDYELSISGIFSSSGWNLSGDSTFNVFAYDEFQDGDLVISEFFYRTPISWRTDDFDRPRYVEIHNTSNRILNLRNWTVNDENISPDNDLTILPAEYLVLTRGEPVFREKFGDRHFVEAGNFPSFSLTTENQIVLKTPDRLSADSLYYDAGLWGGNGVALERYSPDVPAHFRDNWAESEDALLGSPGLSNTLQIPSEAPVAEELKFPEPGRIQVLFSATISEASYLDLSNFSMDEIEFTGVDFFPVDRILELETASTLTDGQLYRFVYQNVEDIFGNNIIGQQEYAFTFFNPFRIKTARVENDNDLIIEFTQPLDISTVSIHNFKLTDETIPLNLEILNSEKIRLEFDHDFSIGGHTIQAANLKSMIGWTIEKDTSFDFYRFEVAKPGQVVINEILYRRLESGSPEFVEIYNRTENNINLAGWTLWDDTGAAEIPENILIGPDEYRVFTDTESFAAGHEKIIYLPGFQSLSNNGDAVVLKNSMNTLIDSLYYRPGWGGNNPGISLERKDPDAVSADPFNWSPSTAEERSTPAAVNSRFEPDEVPPGIIFANLFHPDSLEVHFNKFINLHQSSAKTVVQHGAMFSERNMTSGDELRLLLNENETDILYYDPKNANRIILDAGDIEPGREIILRIENFRDFQGNLTTGQNIPVAQPVTAGDLIFNEIMYQPVSDNRDNLPDQTDYIEIFNRRPFAVSLEGIFLHDAPDENNEFTRMEPVSTANKWVPANGYLLFYPDNETSVFEKTTLAEFFNLPKDMAPFSIRFDRTGFSLPQAGRKIYLADSTDTVLDMADYSPNWHNPNVADTRGISLERIHPEMDTNDPSNWGSSTVSEGGTPGSENSLYQNTGLFPEGNEITLEPNPFSPDSDGYEDNLFIHYSFEDPDYLIRIRIFDRYGRLVRNLADGQPAGLNGTIIWDGKTDSGNRNRIGIYIIYAEAYNSAAGKNLAFKKTVVLARQF